MTITIAGHKVHQTGLGLMGMTWRPQPPSAEQAMEAMKTALSHGSNFWNGGEFYGTPERNSLHLLREYFTAHPGDAAPGRVVLSIKGGFKAGEMVPDGGAANTRRSIEACLAELAGTGKKLDLWEAARVDPRTPIEVTVRTAAEYVAAGKLGGIALSECSADTIRRAARVARIEAVEVEFSLWETEILKNGVAAACAELKIPIIAYSPLGRGFLTGQVRKLEDIPEDDMRRHMPRFGAENFAINLKLVDQLEAVAKKKSATPGQIALAWVRAQSRKPGMPVFIPIPGATTAARVKENLVDVELTDSDVAEIDNLVASAEVAGDRYPAFLSVLNFGNSPPLEE